MPRFEYGCYACNCILSHGEAYAGQQLLTLLNELAQLRGQEFARWVNCRGQVNNFIQKGDDSLDAPIGTIIICPECLTEQFIEDCGLRKPEDEN